jgi:hypothetical protein
VVGVVVCVGTVGLVIVDGGMVARPLLLLLASPVPEPLKLMFPVRSLLLLVPAPEPPKVMPLAFLRTCCFSNCTAF